MYGNSFDRVPSQNVCDIKVVPAMVSEDNSPDAVPDAKPGFSLPVIVAGITTIATMACFAYLFSVWGSSGDISPQDTIRLASAQYVAGNLVVAGDLAASVSLGTGGEENDEEIADEVEQGQDSEKDKERDEENASWVQLQNFLIGAGAYVKSTKEELPVDRREILKEAIGPLEKARDGGFPDGRASDGFRMLGLAYYEMGNYDAASNNLQNAIELDLTLRSELTPILAVASAKRPREDLNEAIVAIDKVLAQESIDTQKRTETELHKIQWLTDLSRFDEAERIIENAKIRIAPEVKLQRTWALNASDTLLLASAKQIVKQTLATVKPVYGETNVAGIPSSAADQVSDSQRKELLSLLKDLAVIQRESNPKLASQSRLTAARALLLADERDLALAELTLVRQQRPFSDEGLEGGMSEMELLADMGLGDEVLQTSRYLSREIAQSRHINFTPKLEDEFRSRIRNVLGRLRKAEEFEASADIAESVTGLFGRAASLIEKGVSYRQWGEATLKAGRGSSGETSRDAFEAARTKFRGAGDAFAAAAKEQFNSKDYVPTLWSAIDAYQQGRHFSKSIPLLEKYLRYEERKRQPRGWVAHGRALLAEGKPDEAMKSLQTCMVEFPRDPMRYEARLLGRTVRR